MIFLHPTFKAVWRASYMSAADWRYKSMQFIRQMVFYHLSMKKALRFSQYFIFRFCRDNSIKLLKSNNGELISSSRQFCTWHICSQKKKKTPSQIWWCYTSHPNTITFREMKCVSSLQEKDADLQDRFVHSQLSPKED